MLHLTESCYLKEKVERKLGVYDVEGSWHKELK